MSLTLSLRRLFIASMWPFTSSKPRTIKLIIRNGMWFVDIPRTSSTSIKFTLAQKFGPGYGKSYDRESQMTQVTLFPDHTSARDVEAAIGTKAWSLLYTFSFVRNPWQRFHSIFKYRVANQDLAPNSSFKDYVRALTTPQYRQPKSPYYYHSYYTSMCDYLMSAENEILVTDVFKYEEREHALEILREKMSIDFSKEWRESTKDSADYRKAYDDETIAIIGQYFADDIKHFNYSFEDE